MAERNGDLIIGIGNNLRGDDGVGIWLAGHALGLQPAAKVMAVQQLTPELAEELADARRVLLVDAWWLPGNEPGEQLRCSPRLRRLSGNDGPVAPGAFSHQLDPAQLLAITELLYGRAPEAWQLLVPAYAMPHHEGFSAQLQRLLPKAQALLLRWAAEDNNHDGEAAGWGAEMLDMR